LPAASTFFHLGMEPLPNGRANFPGQLRAEMSQCNAPNESNGGPN
jgi:hypothetical protein